MSDEMHIGPERERIIYEDYKDGWVVLTVGNTTKSGRLDRIDKGCVILNPSQGLTPREGKLVHDLLNKDYVVPMVLNPILQEISEETAALYCKEINGELRKEPNKETEQKQDKRE